MTQAQMWKVCVEAALTLEAAAYDWRRLLEIEERLWQLECELAHATAEWNMRFGNPRKLRGPSADLRLLRHCLNWVHVHAYDALETELHNQLDIALRCATSALDRLQQWQGHYPLAAAESGTSIQRRTVFLGALTT